MTASEPSTQPLKLIGGLNLSEIKSLFSLNGKLVLTVSGNSVRIFDVATGMLYGVMTTEDVLPNCSENIVAICLNPLSPDTSVISFSQLGRIVFWDYLKLKLLRQHNIFHSLYSGCGSSLQLIWGRALLMGNDIKSEKLDYCFALLVDQEPGLYYAYGSDVERGIKKSTPIIESSSREDQNLKQRARKMLHDTRTSVIFNPALVKVGITIGASNSFLAAIAGNHINIAQLPYRSTCRIRSHMIARNEFTCITAHPKLMMLAAGDSLGRIYIYRDDFCSNSHPIRSVLHWHHSPVNDLCFSNSGAYLYSGGYECVIVRWNTTMSHGNNYFPRTGSPIRFIACDTMNEKIMTVHFDNCIQFTGANLDSILSSLDGSYLLPDEEYRRSIGNICFDPKSGAFVMRGKCGHLQFFSPFLQKNLFQIDFVNMNYLPPEKDKIIVNVDIDKYCISDNGEWLATIEMRDDEMTLLEMRLKFWQFQEDSKNRYSLNTCIHLPHNKPLNCMKFSSDSKHLITTSMDGYFKIWNLINDPNKPDADPFWITQRKSELGRTFSPSKIAISKDLSVLAITSDDKTFLWDLSDPLQMELKGLLLPPESNGNSTIQSIEFGTLGKEHLLSECRERLFRTWDLLTLSICNSWQPPCNQMIKFNAFNRETNRFCLFLSDGSLYLHKPNQDFTKINLKTCLSGINLRLMVYGLFFPQQNKENEIFSQDALCLFDQNQQIFSVGLLEKQDLSLSEDNLELKEDDSELTPYARMLMDEKNKIQMQDTIRQIEVNQYLSNHRSLKKLVECMFTSVPSHVLPPLETISTSFLSLLLHPETCEGDGIKSSSERFSKDQICDDASSEEEFFDRDIEEPMEDGENKEAIDERVIFDEQYDWLSSYM